MIALVDTHVILDVLLNRQAFVADSAGVIATVETSRCKGLLCATTVTTIHYLVRRHLGTESSLERIASLLSLFDIAAVNRPVIESALELGFGNFEDSVLHESGKLSGADCIITRNTSDFRRASLLVYTPAQFLEALD